MRLLIAASALIVAGAHTESIAAQVAPTADEIIAHYLKTVGGMEKIQAVKSLRRVGKLTADGGFEAIFIQENKRPDFVREEFTVQGMTQITSWDGRTGWKINPFEGKKDAESLSDEESHSVLVDADFDEPLVNYAQKGNKVEFTGMDQIEGTDVYKLKVTLKNGDTRIYYLDSDYYVPIKIDDKQMIRGSEREIETILGDYKEVAGWFMPFSIENGPKGESRVKIVFQKIEPNVALDDSRFHKPEIK